MTNGPGADSMALATGPWAGSLASKYASSALVSSPVHHRRDPPSRSQDPERAGHVGHSDGRVAHRTDIVEQLGQAGLDAGPLFVGCGEDVAARPDHVQQPLPVHRPDPRPLLLLQRAEWGGHRGTALTQCGLRPTG